MKHTTLTVLQTVSLAITIAAGGDTISWSAAGASDFRGVQTSVSVPLDTKDLSNPEALADLYRRIRNAARFGSTAGAPKA